MCKQTKVELQIEYEDQFLEFISKLYQNGNSYSFLFQHVQFRNVSKEVLFEFYKIFNQEDLTKEV